MANKKKNEILIPEVVNNLLPKNIPSRLPVPGAPGLLEMINPLDTICRLYSTKKMYDYECKKLEVEKERIEKQAQLAHHQIDNEYNLRLAQLNQEHQKFINKCKIFIQNLENNHVDRQEILANITRLQERLCDPESSLEEKKLIRELISEMLGYLRDNNSQSMNHLHSLTNEVTSIPNNNKKLLEE